MDPWIIIWIAVICGIIWFVKKFGGIIRPELDEKKNGGSSPHMVEKRCPYCGGDASKFYTPGKDKYPAMFTCSDCYRSFGDPSRMSGEESKIVAEQEEVCRKVENLPELQSVIDTVHALVKQKSDFVSVKDGRVFTMKYEYGKGTVESAVCSYTPGLGKIGDQHLAFLCMQYSMQQLGYLGLKMWLMDHGLAWEWPK